MSSSSNSNMDLHPPPPDLSCLLATSLFHNPYSHLPPHEFLFLDPHPPSASAILPPSWLALPPLQSAAPANSLQPRVHEAPLKLRRLHSDPQLVQDLLRFQEPLGSSSDVDSPPDLTNELQIVTAHRLPCTDEIAAKNYRHLASVSAQNNIVCFPPLWCGPVAWIVDSGRTHEKNDSRSSFSALSTLERPHYHLKLPAEINLQPPKSYCCPSERDLVLWLLLSKYDPVELPPSIREEDVYGALPMDLLKNSPAGIHHFLCLSRYTKCTSPTRTRQLQKGWRWKQQGRMLPLKLDEETIAFKTYFSLYKPAQPIDVGVVDFGKKRRMVSDYTMEEIALALDIAADREQYQINGSSRRPYLIMCRILDHTRGWGCTCCRAKCCRFSCSNWKRLKQATAFGWAATGIGNRSHTPATWAQSVRTRDATVSAIRSAYQTAKVVMLKSNLQTARRWQENPAMDDEGHGRKDVCDQNGGRGRDQFLEVIRQAYIRESASQSASAAPCTDLLQYEASIAEATGSVNCLRTPATTGAEDPYKPTKSATLADLEAAEVLSSMQHPLPTCKLLQAKEEILDESTDDPRTFAQAENYRCSAQHSAMIPEHMWADSLHLTAAQAQNRSNAQESTVDMWADNLNSNLNSSLKLAQAQNRSNAQESAVDVWVDNLNSNLNSTHDLSQFLSTQMMMMSQPTDALAVTRSTSSDSFFPPSTNPPVQLGDWLELWYY